MKRAEFNLLVVGDQIENAMTSGKGMITAVEQTGAGLAVRVKWGNVGPEFSYSVHSTAWMHWDKVDNSLTAPESFGWPDA